MDDEQLDLHRVWTVLWSRAPMILGLAVLAAVGVYAMSSLRPDLYRATAKVRVVDPNSEAVFDGMQVRVDPKRDVDTQLALLRSDDIRVLVNQQLGAVASDLRSVSMSGVGSTDLIGITVVSQSPEAAQLGANTYADTYVAQRKEQVTAGFAARADELRNKAADLDAQIADLDTRLASPGSSSDADLLRSQRISIVNQQADLRTRATQFEVEATTRSGNVQTAERANLPSAPYSPTPRRDAVLAGVLAALLGVALAFLLDRLDDRIKSSDDVERLAAAVPVLGAIPVHTNKKKGAKRLPRNGSDRELVSLKSQTAEAYRTLRTSLRFSQLGTKRKTLVVTSSGQGEGKSTVAANLAVTLAESGLRVVVVSADLRRPTLAPIFGITENEKGLTTVLVGDAPLAECLRPVSLSSGQSLYVLPAGPLPQNPAELLGSKGMRDVIATIEQAGADYVLIDSPPVLPVADAMALAQFADGVLVLAVANRTKKGQLAQTLDRLHQVNADVVGVIVNGVPTRGRYGYGRYGYGGYSYQQGYFTNEGGRSGKLTRSRRGQPGEATVGPLPKLFAESDSVADGSSVDVASDTPA